MKPLSDVKAALSLEDARAQFWALLRERKEPVTLIDVAYLLGLSEDQIEALWGPFLEKMIERAIARGNAEGKPFLFERPLFQRQEKPILPKPDPLIEAAGTLYGWRGMMAMARDQAMPTQAPKRPWYTGYQYFEDVPAETRKAWGWTDENVAYLKSRPAANG